MSSETSMKRAATMSFAASSKRSIRGDRNSNRGSRGCGGSNTSPSIEGVMAKTNNATGTIPALPPVTTALPEPDAVVVDGSRGEGGGQVVRNAVAYGALLNRAVIVDRIRANRPNRPGLRPQHLAGIQLAARLGGGTLSGDEIGSSRVSYRPPRMPLPPGATTGTKDDDDGDVTSADAVETTNFTTKYKADTGTAGSIALLLQASLLPALFARTTCDDRDAAVELELRGGTNAEMAPQIDHVTSVFVPFLESHFFGGSETKRCGGRGSSRDASSERDNECEKVHTHMLTPTPSASLSINVLRRGYFPRGGGVVRARVLRPLGPGEKMRPVRLTESGQISEIRIRAFRAGNCPDRVPLAMARAATGALERAWNESAAFRRRFLRAVEDGGSPRRGDVDATDDSSSNGDSPLPPVSSVITSARIEIVEETQAVGSGSGIFLMARTDGGCLLAGSALGNRKLSPSAAGETAASELVDEIASGGCVDRWMQDQIVPFMALADGISKVVVGELTLHTRTAMEVAERLTGCTFVVERWLDNDDNDNSSSIRTKIKGGDEGEYGSAGRITGRHLIRCEGVGFTKKYKFPGTQ